MKKYLLCILCCASLGAAEFKHTITVTPTQNTSELEKKEYLAEIEVTKISDDKTSLVIATPKLVFIQGEKAEVKIESPNQGDILIASVLVPENNSNEAEISIYVTENNTVVLCVEENINISQKAK